MRRRGEELDNVQVDVDVQIDEGRVTSADVRSRLAAADDVDSEAIADRAVEGPIILAGVRNGFPVAVS